VTAPLHMDDAGFHVLDTDRLATPYADDTPPRRMSDPDAVAFLDGSIQYSPSRIFRSDAFFSGGGGMAGTAAGYLTFLETIRTGGGAILSSESTRAMMANQIGGLRINVEPTPSWGFGFGGAVLLDPQMAALPQPAGTWKWGGVYGNHWFVDPQNRLTVVALSNTAIEGMMGAFVDQLLRAIYSA
jgi:CubicO group peptidase (beta-lactamase class C family)